MEHPLPAKIQTSHCKREPNNHSPSPSYCLLQHFHANRVASYYPVHVKKARTSPSILFADTVNFRASCSPEMFGKGKCYWKHTSQISLQCFAIQHSGGPRVLLTHLRKGTNIKNQEGPSFFFAHSLTREDWPLQ